MATVLKPSKPKSDSAAKPGKMTYYFGQTRTDGKAEMKQLLGGKGANLADMTSIGLPVPPGFTITTAVCDGYYKNGKKLPTGLMDEVKKSIAMLEKELGKKFGDKTDPLLMSAHLEHVPDGRRIVDRDDLRQILCACDECRHDRKSAQQLAWRALNELRLVDATMPSHTRGMLWSWESLVDLWHTQYAGHGADVVALTRELVDLDDRLIDARDSYLYMIARLRGEA